MQFNDAEINMPALRERAFNLRWASLPSDVIPLTAADPDFQCAPEIEEAIKRYSAARTFSYGPPEGVLSFRKQIVQFLGSKRSIITHENAVLPVDSAAQGMFIVAARCLQSGDEAIIFDPVDFLFKKAVENAGGKAVLFPIDVTTGAFDLQQLETLVNSKTKLLCICNPLNPSGKVFTKEELYSLGNFAVKHGLKIMSDEIWSDIVYAPETFTSIASLSSAFANITYTIFGFSKSYALAGLRVGFIAAPNENERDILLDVSQMRTTAYGVSTLSQAAAEAALADCDYWVKEFVIHLQKMRDITVDALNKMKNVKCHTPAGCYVAFPDITATGRSGNDISDHILRTAKVAVVPGAAKWFGPGAEGHIRLCYSTSETILREALGRMSEAMEKL